MDSPGQTQPPGDATPIKVAAYFHGERQDLDSRARFASRDRAEQYGRMLANSHQYAEVLLWDAQGQCWEIPANVLVDSHGREI